MAIHPYADRLIVGGDTKFDTSRSWKEVEAEAYALLSSLCEDLSGSGVQIKLNAVLRALGYRAVEMVEEAGLTMCADLKLIDVVDTMLSDIRALAHFPCIRRLTFRVEAHIDFLRGSDGKPGACEIMPNTSFMPVGPLTDNDDEYFKERGFGNRPRGVQLFSRHVLLFGDLTKETIMSPKDIRHLVDGFLDQHAPVTPAVRPIGLLGNERNDANALNVGDAIKAGASAIIVASPIMKAKNRMGAVNTVLDQIGETLTK